MWFNRVTRVGLTIGFNDEVLWLYIPMYDAFGVKVL